MSENIDDITLKIGIRTDGVSMNLRNIGKLEMTFDGNLITSKDEELKKNLDAISVSILVASNLMISIKNKMEKSEYEKMVLSYLSAIQKTTLKKNNNAMSMRITE